jgi:hypothetical protein
METYAVIVGGLVVNLIIASPSDRIPGAELVPTQGQYVTPLHKWNGTTFLPPQEYAVIRGRRVEQRIFIRDGDPHPSTPVGTSLQKINPGEIVSEFRTTFHPVFRFQTVGPNDPEPQQ